MQAMSHNNTAIEKALEIILLAERDINCKSLNLSGLGLEYLPQELFALSDKIESIDLSNNRLNKIPEKFLEFVKLKSTPWNNGFKIDGNYIKYSRSYDGQPPIELIKHLINKQKEISLKVEKSINENKKNQIPELYLDGQEIFELPRNLWELKHLQLLDISNNNLVALPPEIEKLENLQILDISHNQLITLPFEITNLKKLKDNNGNLDWKSKGLHLKGNNFNIPQEIYQKKPSEIIHFLMDLKKEDQPLNEAKLVFIGFGFVGKTSLINCLLGNSINQEEKQTDGISIVPWKFKDNERIINVNIWDFGGQEIMHATHRFFMTKRSAYTLVINPENPRRSENRTQYELEYWLKLINSYCGNVPILVVINKCDTYKAFIDQKYIKYKYNNVVGFLETSCLENTGLDDFRKVVKQMILGLEHIDNKVPASYFKIKSILEEKNTDYISYSEYSLLCKQVEQNFDPKSEKILVELLHDLGTVLNFSDDVRLQDTQVLNPQWVTDGVYKLVNSELLLNKMGRVSFDEVCSILENSRFLKNKEVIYLLDIMKRFELCYEVPDIKDVFFVPDAFQAHQGEFAELQEGKFIFDLVPGDKDSLRWIDFIYLYDFLPESIFPRFIHKTHHLIFKNQCWKSGVILEYEGRKALIKADSFRNIITIRVSGVGKLRSFLSLIREKFESIHSTINQLNVNSKIPLDKSGEILIDYNDLVSCEDHNIQKYFIPKLGKEINVKLYLEGIEDRDYKGKFKNMVAKGEIIKVLEELQELFLNNNEIISQLAEISEIERQIRIGALNPNSVDKQKLNYRLLSLIDYLM